MSTRLTALVCGRQSYLRVRERRPSIDPKFTATQWLVQSKLGWRKVFLRLAGTKVTPALQQNCRLFRVFARDQLRFSSSFKIVIDILHRWTEVIYHSISQLYLDKNCAEWTDCRRSRQDRRQTSMLLVGRASLEEQSSTEGQKLETTERSVRLSQVAYRDDS